MSTGAKILPDLYRDSVTLMQVSAALAARPGIAQASVVMASEGNLERLREAGLLEAGGGPYRPSDLLVALEGEPEAVAAALEAVDALLVRPAAARGAGRRESPPRSIEMALALQPGSNLALVSTPGEYAAAEGRKALALGLNVMLFSDNVELDDEVALKAEAERRGLLVMGPDCGTAIVDGFPLGFANAVRRGPVGVVAASGTGLQQVTCLLDRQGVGISQALGTGGRDLGRAVGGATMRRALDLLGRDPETRVVALVSKPPAPAVAERVLEAARALGKPVVACFLGARLEDRTAQGIHGAATLEDAADLAASLAGDRGERPPSAPSREPAEALPSPGAGQRFVRGLFSGGTFCYEALLLLSPALGPVWSNTPVDAALTLPDPRRSREHTVVDLGDDAFTRGRPHPMIDLGLRNERIVAEAEDPSVAVILLDLVLGYGAHPDPGPEIAAAVAAARARAAAHGRHLAFVASVCGTAADPQGLERQEACLREAGVLLAGSNAAAARCAARIAARAEQGVRAPGGAR